jgi:lysozyme
MTDPRTPIFDFLRPHLRNGWGGLVEGMHRELDALGARKAVPAQAGQPIDLNNPLTARVALEVVGHEGIVLEAYRDSVDVWTWAIGITAASGHDVMRYKDNPQTVRHCLEIYLWLLRAKYLPDVLAEFAGHPLTEAQVAAALSFHYNTGAIKRAGWCDLWKAGAPADQVRAKFMEWRNPPEIVKRRKAEADLFLDGRWSQDGKATVYQRVRKPSYTPDWGSAQRVDITADLAALLAA